MKTAQEIEKDLPSDLRTLLKFDKREIDNPNPYDIAKLNYMDRFNKMINIFRQQFPHPEKIKIADVGCAQANVSLILAEFGFQMTAIDINPNYLDYAKHKQEKGSITWFQGNFDQMNLENKFDAIILGELVEHCAYPEDFIQKALNYLKPNGIILVTTPNGAMFKNKLPTFGQLRKREDRNYLEKKQFGPDGSDHLFLFTINDLKLLLPKNTKIKQAGYLGGTFIINHKTISLLKWMPRHWMENLERLVANLPLLNRYTCYGLYAIITKTF
jgi:2-polyprenyl-3-methyl-5-hydroxy-6-metoxy-1,4-benzoquinol methylase